MSPQPPAPQPESPQSTTPQPATAQSTTPQPDRAGSSRAGGLFDLTGRTALVTGSSRGIGRALAAGLVRAGARVAIHGRDAARTEEVARALGEETGTAGSDAAPFAVDFEVSDAADVERGFDRLAEHWGAGPEILVNNAGIQRRAPIEEFPVADWQDLLDTNLTGPFLCARRAARDMIARGRGKIIQIGSVQSRLARPSIAPYSATKGGIAMLTQGLAADLSGRGIQVNTLAPGYFATELNRALVEDEAFSAWVQGRTPAGRWGEVEDLVGPLLFLASDASAFVTGQTLFVDGGMTAVV